MHKNGSTFPVELFYSNFDHDSEHIIICNAHDMTEHKKAKEILTEALQSAEEANNSKSIFLSSMSHELRTPLNAIIGYSEILLEEAQDKNDEATSSDLKKIRNSGKHLLSLINNVLDLSKIEAGKMDIDNQEFLVGQVIEDVMFTTRPLIEKNNNKFTLNFNDTDLTLFADFTKVKQALINLIGNAAKFTENGNITLNISLEKVSHKPSIRFDVVDTGIGIAEEDIGKLFKEFSQANAQVMTKYGGTGLGLIISRKFCQMMGGDITVKSELEKGSIFTMTLPLQTPPSSDYS
ncbi:MAG: ATP-binding protein [Gammaproteobacteria bacterium]|nr:ATP-binding protein [Gammaproteobacteria bacterium]